MHRFSQVILLIGDYLLMRFFNMNKLNISSCPSCNGKNINAIMNCVDYYATGENFELYQCSDCNFVFTQNAPMEAEIDRYYASPNYISHSDTYKGAMNIVYHLIRHFMLLRKAKLIEKQVKKGTLLDYGAGTGYFAHLMQQRGWKIEAIEKSSRARDFAYNHFGLKIKSEDALNSLQKKSFDIITLWHVIEHIEHLDELWELLSDLLKTNGTLIIACPNCASYDAGIYKSQWAAYDVPRHLWHFTPETMQPFSQRHGFELIQLHQMSFDAYYISMLSEKHLQHSFPFVRGLWNGLRAQLHSINNKKLSSSIIYVFKKK